MFNGEMMPGKSVLESMRRSLESTECYLSSLGSHNDPSNEQEAERTPSAPASPPEEPPMRTEQKPQLVRRDEQPSMPADAEQKRINSMIIDDEAQIKEWHDIQKGFLDEMRQVQPQLREALKKMMSFSDKITEEYALRFAESYIPLYDLIYDGLTSHREKARRSFSDDYKGAVHNFEVYCKAIVRNLAAFGVSIIKTNPGSPFNGGNRQL